MTSEATGETKFKNVAHLINLPEKYIFSVFK
jgi:hypothetical protein